MAGFNRNLHFHHRQSSHSTHYTRPWLGRGRVHREGDGWSLVWPQRQGYSRALTIDSHHNAQLCTSLVSTIPWFDPTHSLQRNTLVVHYTSSSSLLTSSEFLLVHEVNKDDFQLMPTNITSDQIMLQTRCKQLTMESWKTGKILQHHCMHVVVCCVRPHHACVSCYGGSVAPGWGAPSGRASVLVTGGLTAPDSGHWCSHRQWSPLVGSIPPPGCSPWTLGR